MPLTLMPLDDDDATTAAATTDICFTMPGDRIEQAGLSSDDGIIVNTCPLYEAQPRSTRSIVLSTSDGLMLQSSKLMRPASAAAAAMPTP